MKPLYQNEYISIWYGDRLDLEGQLGIGWSSYMSIGLGLDVSISLIFIHVVFTLFRKKDT